MTSASMQLSPDRIQYLKKRKQQKSQAQVILLITSIVAAVIFLCLLIAVIANANVLFKSDAPNTPASQTTPTQSATLQPYDTPSSGKAAGPLILVNSSHAYVFPETTDNLVSIFSNRTPYVNPETSEVYYSYKVSGSSLLMDVKALNALNSWMDAFYAETNERDAIVNSAYRTFEEQKSLNSEIHAGYSDSHTGYLISLKVYKESTTYSLTDPKVKDTYQWLTDNCYKYGFVVRYPEGKEAKTGVSDYTYAFRYVGVPHATYMHDHNLCLEEYIELLHEYLHTGEHLTINTTAGKYEVFYIPASTESNTTIYKTDSAIVSGDNDSGFIITIPIS